MVGRGAHVVGQAGLLLRLRGELVGVLLPRVGGLAAHRGLLLPGARPSAATLLPARGSAHRVDIEPPIRHGMRASPWSGRLPSAACAARSAESRSGGSNEVPDRVKGPSRRRGAHRSARRSESSLRDLAARSPRRPDWSARHTRRGWQGRRPRRCDRTAARLRRPAARSSSWCSGPSAMDVDTSLHFRLRLAGRTLCCSSRASGGPLIHVDRRRSGRALPARAQGKRHLGATYVVASDSAWAGSRLLQWDPSSRGGPVRCEISRRPCLASFTRRRRRRPLRRLSTIDCGRRARGGRGG